MPKCLLQSFAVLLLLSGSVVKADNKNVADYKLRIHIFSRDETTFYHHRNAEEAKGEGRGNLFANGEVRGVDFNFDCEQKLKSSFGYETYRAKWKKPGRELTVLLPIFGKSNAYFTCELKTDVKNYAYARSQGKLISEEPEKFKAWMVKHDYDPEQGKETPVKAAGADAEGAQDSPAPK